MKIAIDIDSTLHHYWDDFAAAAKRRFGVDLPYEHQVTWHISRLKPEQLKQYAQVIGLDRAKFDAALESGRFADKVERDLTDGQRLGVSGTPTFFVNGRRVREASYDALKSAIDAALKR